MNLITLVVFLFIGFLGSLAYPVMFHIGSFRETFDNGGPYLWFLLPSALVNGYFTGTLHSHAFSIPWPFFSVVHIMVCVLSFILGALLVFLHRKIS